METNVDCLEAGLNDTFLKHIFKTNKTPDPTTISQTIAHNVGIP